MHRAMLNALRSATAEDHRVQLASFIGIHLSAFNVRIA
jgi:hypothetical protein